MSDYDIHSCGYYCDRHACILRQRDELRDKLFSDQAANYTQPEEPTIDGWPLWSGLPQPEPVAYINVEERELEWATPIKWETPTVAKMDKVPLYAAPQTYAPSENNLAYERGYIDGQQKQIELAVHKAVKRVSERDWHELTDNEISSIKSKYGFGVNIFSFRSAVRELETWLKERNSTSERNVQTSDNKSAESSQP
jgi:hypothetical protein